MATTNSTCTPPPCWYDGNCSTIFLNPDIAGRGVIAAYLTSTMLAIISSFLAYVTGSLPEAYYADFDRFLIYNKSGRLRIWNGFSKYPDAKRVKAFRRFVLTLSDQQLITGICIILGALVRPFEITSADFNVVISLATFSSTVHLVTLVMLGDYFRAYPARYISRVAFMVIQLALLIPSIMVLTWSTDGYPGLPLSCLFLPSNINTNGSSIILGIIQMIYICIPFGSAILTITPRSSQFRNGALFSISRWLVDSETRSILRSHRVWDSFFAFVDSEIEMQGLTIWKKSSTIFRHYFLQSFWLTFGGHVSLLVYGIQLFLSSYWAPGVGSIEMSSEIGYGQILPVLLLALPFLTLFESICDLKAKLCGRNDTKEDKDGFFGETKASGTQHEVSTISAMPSILEPALVHVTQEFVLWEDEIKRLFPLEHMKLVELSGVDLAQSKQTLLKLLSEAKSRRTTILARSRKQIYCMAGLSISYDILLGWFVHSIPTTCIWVPVLPPLAALMISALPYMEALYSLRKRAENKTKKRLLELMRLTNWIAKEEESAYKMDHITKADDTSVAVPIKFPPRRQLTV